MTRNTGKPAEKEFEAIVASFGKEAYLYRFDDATSFFALAGKAGNVKAQPSDYLLILKGRSTFAEVKSSANKTSFPFSMLEGKQVGKAKQITAAGGQYIIYVKSTHLGKWFYVPFWKVLRVQAEGKESIPWLEMDTWPLSNPMIP